MTRPEDTDARKSTANPGNNAPQHAGKKDAARQKKLASALRKNLQRRKIAGSDSQQPR